MSPSATEGIMTIKASVFMPRSFLPANISEPSQLVPALLHEQTKHLMGVFEQSQFASLNNLPRNDRLGSLGLGSLIDYKILSVRTSTAEDGWEISYVARHRVLVRRDVLQAGHDMP